MNYSITGVKMLHIAHLRRAALNLTENIQFVPMFFAKAAKSALSRGETLKSQVYQLHRTKLKLCFRDKWNTNMNQNIKKSLNYIYCRRDV